MANVTLSAAVRSSLLALQSTTSLIKTTQGRLSTGLRVASAIDDPVSFFQAKGLSDRAGDLTQKKDGIDQGVSSVTAALDAVTAVENIVQQLKGLANSLKSATGTQFTDLITQFNSLRTQIGTLVADASYQGTNLVNNTGQTLTVEFSDKTASLLTVNAANLDQTGLALGSVNTYVSNSSTFMVNFSASTGQSLTAGGSVAFTYKGTDVTFTSASYATFTFGTADSRLYVGTGATLAITQGTVYTASVLTTNFVGSGVGLIVGETTTSSTILEANYSATVSASLTAGATFIFTYQGPDVTIATGSNQTFLYGTATIHLNMTGATASLTLTAGTVVTTALANRTGVTGALTAARYYATASTGGGVTGISINVANDLTYGAASAIVTTGSFSVYVSAGDTAAINASIAQLDASLKTLRSQASSLGSNVALLQTRLNFTNQYVNTLDTGSGKLTLADINQEGANLLALQTRQQLGITSLSFAGKAEQGILRLFR